MASAQKEVVIAAPPSKVWGLLGNVTTWESWNSKVKNGRMLDGEEFFPGATFQFLYDGKPEAGTITLVERLKALSWRFSNVSVAVRLQAEGQSTRASAAAEVSGFMANLRKSKAEQEAAAVVDAYLDGLKRAVES